MPARHYFAATINKWMENKPENPYTRSKIENAFYFIVSSKKDEGQYMLTIQRAPMPKNSLLLMKETVRPNLRSQVHI